MAYMKFYSGSYSNYINESNKDNSLYISNVNGVPDPNGTQNLLSFTPTGGATIPLISFPDVRIIGTGTGKIAVENVSTTAGKYYQIERATDGRLIVNVPWSNTVYTHPTFTAATFGQSSDVTPGHRGTFKVPYIERTTDGHIGISSKDITVTLPAQYSHPAYTAKTAGENANKTLTNGGSFKLPYLVSDTTGHVASSTKEVTITLPTYSPGSALILHDDLNEDGYLWSPRVLNDWITDILGVDPNATITLSYISTALADNDTATGLINLINSKKSIQSLISSPQTSGDTTDFQFISEISQNTQGVITARKETIPTVSSSTAGLAPQGATVSIQSQTTKFLREDGTWAAPSYTIDTTRQIKVNNTPFLDTLTDSTGKAVNYQQGTSILLTTTDATNGTVATITINHGSPGTVSATIGESATTFTTPPQLIHGGTFKVPIVSYDTTGHIVSDSSKTVTYRLPDSEDTWRTIKVDGTDGAVGTNDLDLRSGTDILVTGSSGSVTFSHSNAPATEGTAGTAPAAVKVGRNSTGHTVLGAALTAADITYGTNGTTNVATELSYLRSKIDALLDIVKYL